MFDDFYFVMENPYLLIRKSERVNIEPEEICILQSVLKWFDGKNGLFADSFPDVFRRAKKLMIDSGGYNILKMYSDYPFSIKMYNDRLNFINPDSAACMDYNTVTLVEKIGNKYKDRLPYMIRTIDNYIKQFDMERNYELIIPVQGNTYDEKLKFIDILGERIDLKRVEYWGVGGGGVTNMDVNNFDHFINVRRNLCNYLNRKFDNPKIHIFGGNLTFLKTLIKNPFKFTSVDTWSWGIPMKKGRTFDENLESTWIRDTNLSMTEAKQRCVRRYIRDIAKIKELLDDYNNIVKLL